MSAEDILKQALSMKRAALTVDTKYVDARTNGPQPSDFGFHEEIPIEAVELRTIEASQRKLKARHVSPDMDLKMVKVSDLEEKFQVNVGDMSPEEALAFLDQVRKDFTSRKNK